MKYYLYYKYYLYLAVNIEILTIFSSREYDIKYYRREIVDQLAVDIKDYIKDK